MIALYMDENVQGAITEIEDVFDAVFEWMNQPKAQGVVTGRLQALAGESDDL